MINHEFKPYAEYPDLCVAELPSGDTCNCPPEEHMNMTEFRIGDRVIHKIDWSAQGRVTGIAIAGIDAGNVNVRWDSGQDQLIDPAALINMTGN